jgi:hypothetical protein
MTKTHTPRDESLNCLGILADGIVGAGDQQDRQIGWDT